MCHTFDLQARLAEVQQQAESQTGRFQIIGALYSMCVITRPDSSFNSLLSACSACIVFLHLR
jgi:hypothetical protein